MTRSFQFTVQAVVIAALLPPGPISAQELTESTSENWRLYCDRAAEQFRSGPTEPGYVRAIGQLESCDETGPPLLVQLWREPPADSLTREQLIEATAGLRDRRLLDAVEHAATDPGRPVDVRLSALRVLAQYFNPHIHPPAEMLPPPPYGEQYLWASIDHPNVTKGVNPFPASIQQEILAILSQLAESDPDPVVRRSAEYLVDWLPGYRDR